MDLPFAKLQAAGNAYLAVDGRELALDWPALARAMAHPRLGVGSDGLLVACRSDRAAVRMRVFNSDGSESEMSGNGIRLFAAFVLERGITAAPAAGQGLRVETGGGVRTVWPELRAGRVVGARVAMGVPELAPERIPAAAPGRARLVDFPLEVAGRVLPVTCLAVGNPHCVWLADRPVADVPLEALGPAVEHHPFFPNRVNFEVVNVLDRGTLRARVHERGEGETPSSGTCSTAAVVAARLHGLVDERVEVRLPGRVLRVRWPGEGREALLEGPAEEVFRGVWPVREA